MARLTINLDGTKGLAPKFYGDANDRQGYGSFARPRLRALGQAGQMAAGYWNPFRAFGYMAPPTSMTNSSCQVLTHDASYSIVSELRATLYDGVGTNGQNGLGVWAADQQNVWYQYAASGDPTFALHNMVHLSANQPRITDLERYQLNGSGRVFFSYQEQAGVGGDIGVIVPDASSDNLNWLSGSVSGAFHPGALRSGSSLPGRPWELPPLLRQPGFRSDDRGAVTPCITSKAPPNAGDFALEAPMITFEPTAPVEDFVRNLTYIWADTPHGRVRCGTSVQYMEKLKGPRWQPYRSEIMDGLKPEFARRIAAQQFEPGSIPTVLVLLRDLESF